MSIAEEMIFCLVHEIVDDIFADGEEAPASALPAVSAVVRPQDTKKEEDDEASLGRPLLSGSVADGTA